jgi:spermidine synthase
VGLEVGENGPVTSLSSGAPPPDERVPVVRAVDFGQARLLPDVDRPRAWLLTVDGAPQSYVDLDNPLHLEFEYARRLAHALDVAAPRGVPLDVMHLGGGALTLPRYLAATRPGSRQHVVEADRRLAALVAEHLPLDAAAARLATHTEDARAWLERVPDARADVLVTDVFGGSRVPGHLTSVAFADQAARVLRPGGMYLANLADAAPFTFLGSQIATLLDVFGSGSVCLLAEPAVLRGRRFGNTVLAARRDGEPPLDALARRLASDPFPARVVHGAALRELAAGAGPVHDETAVPSPEPPPGAFGIG